MPPSPQDAALEVEFIRACFPALAQSPAADIAFFENAGGSHMAATVLDALIHYCRHNRVQPGSGALGGAAMEQMVRGRDTMAALLGVAPPTLTLGPSTTQNLNTLAAACDPLVRPGDQVIVSGQDHEANIGAWQRLCRRRGAERVMWEADARSGELSVEWLRRHLSDRVRLVCMTHASNIIGTINPVEEVAALCREHGARLVLDGVSAAPHCWPDEVALAADAYCFSTYKTYATHLGVMYTAPSFAAELAPQCHEFNHHYPDKRLDAAGPDHAAIAALAGLGEYFAAAHRHHFGPSDAPLHTRARAVSALMHRHEAELCAPLLDELQQSPLRILGRTTMAGREANLSLVSPQHSSAALCAALDAEGIAVGHGHFYAKRLLHRLGVKDSEDGVLRISLAHYNTESEVTRLIDALRTLH